MHRLKFLSACSLDGVTLEETALATEACKSSLRFFRSNVERVQSLLSLPGFTAWVMTEHLVASERAKFEVLGSSQGGITSGTELIAAVDEWLSSH